MESAINITHPWITEKRGKPRRYSHFSWPMILNKQFPRTMVWASLPLQLSNTSVQLVWRESMKEVSTTPLNSFNQGKSWQRPCIEILHVKKLWIPVALPPAQALSHRICRPWWRSWWKTHTQHQQLTIFDGHLVMQFDNTMAAYSWCSTCTPSRSFNYVNCFLVFQ